MGEALSVGEAHIGSYNERDEQWYRRMLFPEEQMLRFSWFGLRKNPLTYYHLPAGTKFDPDYGNKMPERIVLPNILYGIKDFFTNGVIVGDIGCGQGIATTALARRYPHIRMYGIDNAFGKTIPKPAGGRNLTFYTDDWEQLSNIPDGTFDRVIGVESFGRYGNNPKTIAALQRITKAGTVLRATFDHVMIGNPLFGDRLAEAGWDVYEPVLTSGRTIVAIRHA